MSDNTLEYTAYEDYLSNRFNMLTEKDSKDLAKLEPLIKTNAFFSAKVAKSHVLEKIRKISDDYSMGKINLAQAREQATKFLKSTGYLTKTFGNKPKNISEEAWGKRNRLSNLASVSRLNLIFEQNRLMATAVGDYQRRYDPDIKEMFPCVIYHAESGSTTRPSHKALDGKIFDKDDPFLLTHTPPWDFRCRCYLEDCERPEDNNQVEKMTKLSKAKKDISPSGYSFRPDLAFQANDMGFLDIKSREQVLNEMTDLVRKNKISQVTFLATSPKKLVKHTIENITDFENNMEKLQSEATAFVKQANLDPMNMPDYKGQKEAFKLHSIANFEDIPTTLKNKFPDTPVEIGALPKSLQEGLGLKEAINIKLSKGDARYGISHNWRHHKEMFTNLEDSRKVLEETIGNSNARCVFSCKYQQKKLENLIIIHNPTSKAYCVMRLSADKKSAGIVSWHRANRVYGNKQWSKN